MVPTHLGIMNRQQRTILRFPNGIANTGSGPWRLRPDFQPSVVNAIQEIFNADGNIAREHLASTFEFHEAHNHWYIDDIALFEVRVGSPTGRVVGENSIKVTFCLIDWYKLDDTTGQRASEPISIAIRATRVYQSAGLISTTSRPRGSSSI